MFERLFNLFKDRRDIFYLPNFLSDVLILCTWFGLISLCPGYVSKIINNKNLTRNVNVIIL